MGLFLLEAEPAEDPTQREGVGRAGRAGPGATEQRGGGGTSRV